MLKETQIWDPEKVYKEEYWGWMCTFETEGAQFILSNNSFVHVIVHSFENDALKVVDEIFSEKFIPGIKGMNFKDTAFFVEIYPEKIHCKISQKGQTEITRTIFLDNPPKIIIAAEVERLIKRFFDEFAP